ncbi:MAG: hypothetical protein PHX93_02435 [Candidatus Peribacteraceae bacterium]|jgi:uncharacterized protein YacL|nr:hypothetical protein [Candidatus Peribacteraceae bacterium]
MSDSSDRKDFYANTGKSAAPSLVGIALMIFLPLGALLVGTETNNMPAILTLVATTYVLIAYLHYRFDRKGKNGVIHMVSDFIFGVVLTIAGGMVVNFFIGLFAMTVAAPFRNPIPTVIIGIACAVGLLYLCVRFLNRKGRRYISIGMLASAIVPLFIFGACLYSFNGL